jgi:hypothetical protein
MVLATDLSTKRRLRAQSRAGLPASATLPTLRDFPRKLSVSIARPIATQSQSLLFKTDTSNLNR